MERGLDKKWIAFGAVFNRFAGVKKEESRRKSETGVPSRGPRIFGFRRGRVLQHCVITRHITLESHDRIACAPLAANGTLRDVCIQLRERMMASDPPLWEGVVLNWYNFSEKWKTGSEDGTRGHDVLVALVQNLSSTVLDLAGVDWNVLDVLTAVAKPKSHHGSRKMGASPATSKALCADDVLEKAWMSALSKYDALDVYLQLDEKNEISTLLRQELFDDLAPANKGEIKFISGFVAKKVGQAFGRWKKSNAQV